MRRKGSKWIVQSSKTSSGKEGGFEPEDTVMRTWQANGADKDESRKIELLATYSGFSRTFSLRDLAIIAKAVLAKSDRYLLLMQQCYWFTRTLVQISVAIYSPTVSRKHQHWRSWSQWPNQPSIIPPSH